MSNSRIIKASNCPEIISIKRPFSLFDFVEGRFKGLESLRRILSQIRSLGGATMVLEKPAFSSDILEENEDIETRYRIKPESALFRLSFFSKEFSTPKELASANDEQFLGYAIVKEDSVGNHHMIRIYESVVRTSLHPNNCVRHEPVWQCSIHGNNLQISGYLYAQQNDMTNVCAHVALRSAVAGLHKGSDLSYRKINKLVGIDHVNRKAGGKDGGGLSVREMMHVLESVGTKCVVGDYQQADVMSTEIPFHKYIYGSIESGFSSLLAFKTNSGSGHVIPVFGHTFNEDTWVSNAELSYFKVSNGLKYIPSESWLSMYLAHDDNFGSNFCIPRRYLNVGKPCCVKEKKQRCAWVSGVAAVIGTLPSKVELKPVPAEIIGADYLFTILPKMPQAKAWEKTL
jgi:hypothetical protein